MRGTFALVLSIFMLTSPASAVTVTLIEGGVVNRADPSSQDVFYTAPAINLQTRPDGVFFDIADPLGLDGSFDLVVSTILGVSDWAYTAWRTRADGVETALNFGVDVRETSDFSIPLDFSLGEVIGIELISFTESGSIVQVPIGYTGDELPFLLVFGADLSRGLGTGGGASPTDPLPPPAAVVPLPAAALLLLSGLGGLGLLRGASRLRRSTA